jgi:hypothetical protein
MSRSPLLRLERHIAAGERGGIMDRWEYGREVLKAKAGRRQLPHGMIADLVKMAASVGTEISEQEIQRRIRCATVYDSEAKVRQALTEFGSWSALVNAGFPAVEVDEIRSAAAEFDDPEDDEPEYEQLTLIPGAPEVLRIRGRSVKLDEATLAEFRAYCEQSAEITANFAKRDAQLWAAYRAMREVTDDPNANAVEAWKRATGEPEPQPEPKEQVA